MPFGGTKNNFATCPSSRGSYRSGSATRATGDPIHDTSSAAKRRGQRRQERQVPYRQKTSRRQHSCLPPLAGRVQNEDFTQVRWFLCWSLGADNAAETPLHSP
jgi:hypothetical protein